MLLHSLFLSQRKLKKKKKSACKIIKNQKGEQKLTRTQGSHAEFVASEAVASAIPVGGPRKFSHTSRSRDSSASLHFKSRCNALVPSFCLIGK